MPESDERPQTLRSVPLFAELDDEALARIADRTTEFDAPPAHVFAQPGSPGSGMFVVKAGSVVVEMPGGRTVELGPGEFFGELALLLPAGVRAARVSAKTAVRCLAVSRRDFDELLEAEPRVAVPMLRVLARRLAETIAH